MAPESPKFSGKRLVLGVSGSIAAYKAVGLLRSLMKEGADVRVVMSRAATRFVTPLTFETLSGHPVVTDLFEPNQGMAHLALPEQADAVLVAPATANLIAKCALGLADDALTTLLLNVTGPLILAPAMDGGMWDHPATAAHAATLRRRGVRVLDPEEGPLASGRIGKGRLAEDARILAALEEALAIRRDWAGQRLLVSAGQDGHWHDPMSTWRLTAHAYHAMARELTVLCAETGCAPPALVLEGGYSESGLRASIAGIVAGLLGSPAPESLPADLGDARWPAVHPQQQAAYERRIEQVVAVQERFWPVS